MSTLERAILRAIFAMISLILFVLGFSLCSLQSEVKELNTELNRVEDEHKKEMEELEKDFEHKFEVYQGLCDAIIYGREEEW